MLSSFIRAVLSSEPEYLLKQYRTEYGPYLKRDGVNTSESFYKLLISLAGKYLDKDTVALDVGCGLGRFVIDIGNRGVKEVIGVEINQDEVYEANAIAGGHREQLLSYPCRGAYSFMVGDALKLPMKDESFTFVSGINLIDRVKDPYRCVRELSRVLKKGGILFLVDPYHWDSSETPVNKQVKHMKELMTHLPLQIIMEKDPIPYEIFINSRLTLHYKNHLVVFRKDK